MRRRSEFALESIEAAIGIASFLIQSTTAAGKTLTLAVGVGEGVVALAEDVPPAHPQIRTSADALINRRAAHVRSGRRTGLPPS